MKEFNKLAELIANGVITVEELAGAPMLIERAKLVDEGVKACQKTLLFPLGSDKLRCYDYTDHAGEYQAWGDVSRDGLFTCWTNWCGKHEIGRVNLMDPKDVFMMLEENKEFAPDLERFLTEQIEKNKRE